LTGSKDSLPLYTIGKLRITDQRVLRESGKEFHPILQYTGKSCDEVSGTVFNYQAKKLPPRMIMRLLIIKE
jgi:hypothetical protein